MKEITVRLAGGRQAQIHNPEREDFPQNLGGAIQYSLASILVWVMETMGEGIGTLFGSALVSFLEIIEPALVDYLSPILDPILEIPDLPPYVREFLENLRHPTSEAGAGILAALGGSAGGAIVGSFLGAALSPITYWANARTRPARPSPAEAFAMAFRGKVSPDTLNAWLSDMGWPVEAIEGFTEILRPRAGGGDLLSYYWRKFQDPELVRSELQKRGYHDDDIDKLIELSRSLPGPGDLVTFALREVWKPEFRPELLTPDAPARYYELMAKHGFAKDFAEDYWASHWRLPSPGQGMEMFWRLDEFDESDLRALLTRLDILPAYHDGLIATAYRPYTRVDVRRMHQIGILSDDDLLRAYMDLGFDEEKAGNMALFTVMWNLEEESIFTKAEILSGYRLGMIGVDEAVELFSLAGRSEEYARYVLALEDYKREKSLTTERVRYIRVLFVNGEVDRTGAVELLGALGFTGERINRYLEEWQIKREAKVARLTLSQIEEFYRDGILDDPTARTELRKRHFPEYMLGWILMDWDQQIVDAARKEHERAQKEQERIRRAKFRNERTIALAGLNATIAEIKLMIAELKVALFYAVEDEQIEIIKEAMILAKAEIARLQLSKAELPVVAD